MPTLPERATSILTVLGRFAPAHDTSTSAFDWRALVAAGRPGAATQAQRRQAQRLQTTLAGLRTWAEARGLPPEHLEESAVYATVCTAPGTPDAQAQALGLVIYWIYLLDDVFDRRDFARDAQADARTVAVRLDTELAAILRPLHPLRALALGATSGASGLLRRRGRLAPRGRRRAEAERLGRDLAAVLRALAAAWDTLPPDRGLRRAFRSVLVRRELARCARAMRAEVLWNLDLARRPDGATLPSFGAYLRNGAVSIGMPAVAAAAASYEPRPAGAWRQTWRAIVAGGGVVRLTNDQHTYFADAEEGKASAVTIRLRDRGLAARGLDPDASPAVRAAQADVGRELERAVGAFAGAQADLPEGPLAHCARHAVAFALAVYGDGSRHRTRPAA